jgi:hypothetical protein
MLSDPAAALSVNIWFLSLSLSLFPSLFFSQWGKMLLLLKWMVVLRAIRQVVFDKNGVLEQIGSGKGYVDMSTVDAATSSKISEASHSLPRRN